YVDRNKNLAIDPSEPWDSVSISLADSARTTLVIFTHDTIPPHIREVRATDSLSLVVSFDKPIDPSQTLTAANFAVIGPDSAPLAIVSAGPPPKDTTPKVNPAVPLPPAARPPARARADTVTVVKPVMPRPVPISEVVVKMQRPRNVVLDALRDSVEAARSAGGSHKTEQQWVDTIASAIRNATRPSLRRVINATGVILHTNLGRAPLAGAAIRAIEQVAEGFSNLEYDIASGKRGSRYSHCVGLLTQLTGAEDALVVNNCAAA